MRKLMRALIGAAVLVSLTMTIAPADAHARGVACGMATISPGMAPMPVPGTGAMPLVACSGTVVTGQSLGSVAEDCGVTLAVPATCNGSDDTTAVGDAMTVLASLVFLAGVALYFVRNGIGRRAARRVFVRFSSAGSVPVLVGTGS